MEGERLMPAVRGLLNSAEQLSQLASSIRGLDSGTVRIGAFTSVAVHWLPGVFKEFQADYPKVDFKLLNGDYHDVEQWLADGSVDMGFVAVPCGLDCECIPLVEDRLLAILPENSRFASYPRFPLTECGTEPFISLLESSDHDARRAPSVPVSAIKSGRSYRAATSTRRSDRGRYHGWSMSIGRPP